MGVSRRGLLSDRSASDVIAPVNVFEIAALLAGSKTSHSNFVEYMNMKPLKVAAAVAAVLSFGYVQAQDMAPATQPTNPTVSSADSVGGVPATRSDAGAPMGKTRAQVRQELQQARQSGELDRINAEYGGNKIRCLLAPVRSDGSHRGRQLSYAARKRSGMLQRERTRWARKRRPDASGAVGRVPGNLHS
ncbi:DUF4148 domain-containing protein [Paraburkholderia sp. BL18I3N2]|uniref:DUF4148 domain-containing protein n=1 Tax=Paraburkholderia sp. BL18I3N2 TaxID=1938799 RepID=UPI000D05823F